MAENIEQEEERALDVHQEDVNQGESEIVE